MPGRCQRAGAVPRGVPVGRGVTTVAGSPARQAARLQPGCPPARTTRGLGAARGQRASELVRDWLSDYRALALHSAQWHATRRLATQCCATLRPPFLFFIRQKDSTQATQATQAAARWAGAAGARWRHAVSTIREACQKRPGIPLAAGCPEPSTPRQRAAETSHEMWGGAVRAARWLRAAPVAESIPPALWPAISPRVALPATSSPERHHRQPSSRTLKEPRRSTRSHIDIRGFFFSPSLQCSAARHLRLGLPAERDKRQRLAGNVNTPR